VMVPKTLPVRTGRIGFNRARYRIYRKALEVCCLTARTSTRLRGGQT
jgi:hypothetical protein